MTKSTKALIAGAAVAGLLTGAIVSKSDAASNDAGTLITKVAPKAQDCKGQNDCKGQGGCDSGDQGCKGKNTCKGKGGCKAE
jgi:hypothetical protein